MTVDAVLSGSLAAIGCVLVVEIEKKSRLIEHTPRKPQQPGNRDHLGTAREKPRPTRYPVLARFHRYRV